MSAKKERTIVGQEIPDQKYEREWSNTRLHEKSVGPASPIGIAKSVLIKWVTGGCLRF